VWAPPVKRWEEMTQMTTAACLAARKEAAEEEFS